MQYQFVILGHPFGKERPRGTKFSMQPYTPKRTKDYEKRVREASTKQGKMIEGPLKVDIKAYFEVPKSYTKKRRATCLAGLEYPTKKPDKDNIEKIVLDGMNPVYKLNKATHKRELKADGFYLDDKQVVNGTTIKLYGEPARVEVTVTELCDEGQKLNA